MDLQNLKEKGRNLMLLPAAALATMPAFAGDMEAAVNAGKASVEGSKGDVVAAFGVLVAIAAVIWIGRKVIAVFSGR